MSSNVMNRLLIASKHLSSQGTFFFYSTTSDYSLPRRTIRKIPEKGATILYSTANDPQLRMNPKTANDSERKIGMAWTHHVNFIIITKSQTKSEILLLK